MTAFILAMPRHLLSLPPAAERAPRTVVEVNDTPIRERREPRPAVLAVDFDFIPGSQRDMHDRLVNWARSLTSKPHQEVSAGFSLFRSSDARVTDRRPYGLPTVAPINPEDAHRIAMLVAELAQDARNDGFRQAKALDWYYRLKCRNAPGMGREMCLSMHGLAETVIAARARLIELV